METYDIIFYFPYIFYIKPYFCWLINSFKQAVWQRSEAKCSFHIFLHIFIGKTNDFLLTSLKAATLISPPPQHYRFFYQFFTQNMYFILKYPTNPHKKIFQCCICCPFCYLLKFCGWIFCRKKFLYWLRWPSRETVIFF